MTDYLILFAIVLGVNLMPAFGPPTWSVILVYGLNGHLPVVPMVLTGAVAAACGRFALAHAFRLLGNRLPGKTKRNLDALRKGLERRKRTAIVGLCLFALSPLPSTQFFEAAGLARAPLLPLTAAFFVGRIISYGAFAFGAQHVRQTSMGETFRHAFTSPVGIAIQLGLLALLVALSQIDWAKRLRQAKS